jgi:hypothetical protein
MQKNTNVSEFIEDYGAGPHNYCNWVVYPGVIPPGRILMSSHPCRTLSDMDLELLNQQIHAFQTGVTYICLQEKSELKSLGLPIYWSPKKFEFLRKLAGLTYLDYDNRLEIPDVNISNDKKVYWYTNQLYERYLKGENFVIHCLGGHGRTGTIAGILLGFILVHYGIVLKATELLNVTRWCHDQRVSNGGWSECPQTLSQKLQIQRLYYQFIKKCGLSVEEENLIPKLKCVSNNFQQIQKNDNQKVHKKVQLPQVHKKVPLPQVRKIYQVKNRFIGISIDDDLVINSVKEESSCLTRVKNLLYRKKKYRH